jgi:hypothetical protein
MTVCGKLVAPSNFFNSGLTEANVVAAIPTVAADRWTEKRIPGAKAPGGTLMTARLDSLRRKAL